MKIPNFNKKEKPKINGDSSTEETNVLDTKTEVKETRESRKPGNQLNKNSLLKDVDKDEEKVKETNSKDEKKEEN